MAYVRSLNFEETPDYAVVREMFKDLFFNLGYEYDAKFDWIPQEKQSIFTPSRRQGLEVRKIYTR